MTIRLYGYENCGTCGKAMKFLAARGVDAAMIPIRQQPPSPAELELMLAVYGGEMRRLFNTSGVDYKAMKLSEKLPMMNKADALALLAKNGNLVKRPFVIRDGKGVVGFDEAAWKKFFA
jgi:arsenate reductase (glutaredoxin)